MFKDVFDHFGAENVTGFAVKWVPAMPSNLDAFNANIRAGMSYSDAARNTFTGHMLSKYDITKAAVDAGSLRGAHGWYTNVEVLFTR